MVTQMIAVGEQTGAMDAMLQKIADFYEDEVDAAVKDLLTALEPIMIVFLGVVVGGVVISMYLPLFSLIGKLARATREMQIWKWRAGKSHLSSIFLSKMELGMSGKVWGCRFGAWNIDAKSPGVGGLADACPPAVDRPDPGSRGGVAAVRSHASFAAVFPADCHSVDHHWDSAPDIGAAAAGSDVAGKPAGVPATWR